MIDRETERKKTLSERSYMNQEDMGLINKDEGNNELLHI